FYNQTGDKLFQEIMGSEEYYVTRCEAEIFQTHAREIATVLKNDLNEFDLIELGAGDASKTIHLLEKLHNMGCHFQYVPIDISASMIRYLEQMLPEMLPGMVIKGLTGEYLDMLYKAAKLSTRKKVVMFLGSNIGNMNSAEALIFLKKVRAALDIGDRMLIGFDLKKDPATILAAYNDASGFTREFNLNLLMRINRELGADFDIHQFEHFPTYDPISGSCRSFLVSKQQQKVHLADEVLDFKEGEIIDMELSQKYDLHEINSMAESCGFLTSGVFMDSREWFVDTIWECV
ncbi:MAG: L-histidine N(alpha)-methyltransferase, partial [Chitinophagaceae bacterium]